MSDNSIKTFTLEQILTITHGRALLIADAQIHATLALVDATREAGR